MPDFERLCYLTVYFYISFVVQLSLREDSSCCECRRCRDERYHVRLPEEESQCVVAVV